MEIKELLEDNPSLKQILQNIDQVVWMQDLNSGRIFYVSPAFEAVWGRSGESLEVDPTTLIQTIHPEDRVKVMAARLDDHRTSTSQAYRIIRPDGSLRWISARTFTIREETADATYQVWVAQDITDQSKLDQTLHKALDRSREQFNISRRMSLARKPDAVLKTLMSASELRSAQQAFALFFEPLPDGPDLEIEVIASWSSRTDLTGLDPNEATDDASLFDDLALLNLFHPSRPVIVSEVSTDQRLTPAIRDQLLEKQILTVAIFPLIALGKWLGCLLVCFSQEKHFDSIELQHIKVLVDQASITLHNLQLLEIEAASRHEAERANEIKTRFLAMITHELRTPLTSIKGFATTLLAEGITWEPEEQRDFIQTIEQEANRLQELIDQLLDLSRLEAGMLPIAQASHTLQEIIIDAFPQLNSLTIGQRLTLHLPPNLPPVYVDAKRIAQVVVNLVRNASSYSPPGSEINLSASLRGAFMQININDQGPGIPPGERQYVFQAFQRGANVEHSPVKGAGLGLAICKGLVEAHGGRIWIKKKTTPGATISFTIPIASSRKTVIPSGEAA